MTDQPRARDRLRDDVAELVCCVHVDSFGYVPWGDDIAERILDLPELQRWRGIVEDYDKARLGHSAD